MNNYSEQLLLTVSVNKRELMSQELAMHGSEITACQKQVGQFLGAYTVAVQIMKDSDN